MQITEQTAQTLIQRLDAMAEGCADARRLEKRLYGNGQPGDIGLLWNEVKEIGGEIKKLGKTIAYASGGVAVFFALLVTVLKLSGKL